MLTRFLLRMVAVVAVLAMSAFASSSSAPNGQLGAASSPVINTVLQPDLSLHSTLSLPLLPQAATELGKTASGFCLCGCGVRCSTNADCGPGGQCRPFITCCDKAGQIQRNEGIGLSSHRGEMPEVNTDCK